MKCTILLFVLASFLYSQDESSPILSYADDVNAWHQQREASLKQEHGWLSLVALEWLHDGVNAIKSTGVIIIKNNTVTLRFNKDIEGMRDGEIFTSGTILPDQDKIIFGKKALSVIQRSGKYAVRIWDSTASARIHFKGIQRYPVRERWNISARWVPYDTVKRVEIPTVISDLIQYGTAPGVAVFTLGGKEYRLEPTFQEGDDEYFFVFGDRTNGKETYGAGRFLYAKPPVDGVMKLDFNRAYNPPCVFSDYATCPIPSRQNILPVKIEAGEKNYHMD